MAELEADVGAAEHVHGDGQLDLLRPPGAVVVVEHQGVVLVRPRLAGACSHVALKYKVEAGKGRGGGWMRG